MVIMRNEGVMWRNEGKKAKKRGLGIEPKNILTLKTDYDYQNKNYCFFPAFYLCRCTCK